jgi:ketosteroid isomerase-like protein
MRHLITLTLATILLSTACNNPQPPINKEALKQQILQAEMDFAKMAAEKGVAEAFYFYADSMAVIKRENDTLIKGRENIRAYYQQPSYANAVATWAPDFIDVSSEGNMAYTYGKYTWRSKDTANQNASFSGIFHTVWKRQADGTWKYVWD